MAEKLLVSIGLVLALISGLRIVNAASPAVYFESPAEVAVGQEFTVRVLVDTDQPVNAYSVSVVYPSDALSVASMNSDGSIVTVWQDQPSASQPGAIEIKGGSIAPFQGEHGALLSVRLKAIRPGSFELRFGNPFFYLANGKGTKVSVAAEPFRVEVHEGLSENAPGGAFVNEGVIAPRDTTPPEIELTARTVDPLNPRQKFFSFSARDAEEGVETVSYRSRSWVRWGDAHPAINPITVPLSAWAVSITAVDYAGNSKESVFYDGAAFMKGPLVLLALLGAVAVFAARRVRRRRVAEGIA